MTKTINFQPQSGVCLHEYIFLETAGGDVFRSGSVPCRKCTIEIIRAIQNGNKELPSNIENCSCAEQKDLAGQYERFVRGETLEEDAITVVKGSVSVCLDRLAIAVLALLFPSFRLRASKSGTYRAIRSLDPTCGARSRYDVPIGRAVEVLRSLALGDHQAVGWVVKYGTDGPTVATSKNVRTQNAKTARARNSHKTSWIMRTRIEAVLNGECPDLAVKRKQAELAEGGEQ